MATLNSGATVEGLRETLRAFSRLDKAAQKAARDEVQKVADVLARAIIGKGLNSRDSRNRAVAESIRATRERTPVIKVGNAKRVPVTRKGVGPRTSDVMFGMEFGSDGTGGRAVDIPTRRGGAPGWRFPPRTPRRGRGNEGYWIYPTLRSQQQQAVTLWAQALEKVAAEWTK